MLDNIDSSFDSSQEFDDADEAESDNEILDSYKIKSNKTVKSTKRPTVVMEADEELEEEWPEGASCHSSSDS